MSIKKILIIFLALTIVLSLGLFAFLSQNYMHAYFSEYINSKYLENVDNIVDFGQIILSQGYQQRSFLNSYIDDPIYYVEIYDTKDNLIMNSGLMGKSFVYNDASMMIDTFEISLNAKQIGYVHIIKEANILNTETNKLFNRALIVGALVSSLATILCIGILLIFAIRAASKNVNQVVDFATDDRMKPTKSNIVELNTIINAIEKYRIKLKTKERVKKEKFDLILHETKTPITIIKSQLEGILDGVISSDYERTQSMIDELDNLDNMLKDITNIVEGVIKEDDMDLKSIEYSAELQKIIKSLSLKFNHKNLKLLYDSKPLNITANKELLNKAIYNLLINSYKYTDAGQVKISTDDKSKTISIKDTGRGIASEDIDHIFKSYYRGKNVREIEGEGIGLSNVKKNIERMNGTIQVHSKENHYTEFIITLKY